MAEIQLFKTKITLACKLIRSSESDLKQLDQPFTFPPQKDECEVYIRERTAQLNHLTTTITKAKEHHDAYVGKAIEAISSRPEQKEREKLMLDLNNHLELESNGLEIETLQWLNKIEFRKEELAQQASLITEAASVTNQPVSNQSNSFSGADTANSYERSVRVRRPMLEVPTFFGNFREFNTFWSVFESLIHNDADLSDQEKFLFLKQAVKGKAAASISSIPVIGDKYNAAVSILKKQYDRSSSIADILINEIEHLPRAQGSSTSCRNTLSAISSRIVHLEQAGVPMSADRVWRRLILSKFTENICSQVIKKENEAGTGFNVNDIIEAVDEIITLQETTELTTRTLFGDTHDTDDGATVPNNHEIRRFPSHRTRNPCLCGEIHSPQQCIRFPTPEARRMEAKRQRVCWKCFDRNHGSRSCTALGQCPKCNEDHHSSLCTSSGSGRDSSHLQSGRRSPLMNSTQQREERVTFASQNNCVRQPRRQSPNSTREVTRIQPAHTAHTPSLRNCAVDSQRSQCTQHVLQTASALIFNEAEMEYQPISILLDSGAQMSFMRTESADQLQLPTLSSTTITTSGMGELQETFNSKEVGVTLKSLHSTRKLKRQPIHSKKKLTSPTWTAKLSHSDMSFINKRNISIAQHSLKSSEVTPHLIIGQDLLHQVICYDSPTMTLPSGLILTPTIFGYTISGTSTIRRMKAENGIVCSSHYVALQSPAISKRFGRSTIRSFQVETLSNTFTDQYEASAQHTQTMRRPSTRKRLKQATQTNTTGKYLAVTSDNSPNTYVNAPPKMIYRTATLTKFHSCSNCNNDSATDYRSRRGKRGRRERPLRPAFQFDRQRRTTFL